MECPAQTSMAFNDNNVEQSASVHLGSLRDSLHEWFMPRLVGRDLVAWQREAKLGVRLHELRV